MAVGAVVVLAGAGAAVGVNGTAVAVSVAATAAGATGEDVADGTLVETVGLGWIGRVATASPVGDEGTRDAALAHPTTMVKHAQHATWLNRTLVIRKPQPSRRYPPVPPE